MHHVALDVLIQIIQQSQEM